MQRPIKTDVQCMCDSWKRLLQKITSHGFTNLKYHISQGDSKFKLSKLKITGNFQLLRNTLARIVLGLKQTEQVNKKWKHFISTHKNTIVVKDPLKGKKTPDYCYQIDILQNTIIFPFTSFWKSSLLWGFYMAMPLLCSFAL